MPKIQGQQKVVMVAGGLQKLGVANTIEVTRGEAGMEAEIVLGPTEDLTQAAIFVASLGLALHYDGKAIHILSRDGSMPQEGYDVMITEAALVTAEQAGLDLAALFAAQIGTGLNGRITKDDVLAYISRLTNPPQPTPPPPPPPAPALTRIEISQQPTNGQPGVTLNPVLVHLFDQDGQPFDGDVGVRIGGPLTTLLGETLVATVGGLATFDDLSIPDEGTGYSLLFSAGDLSVESVTFDIVLPTTARGYE